jgi:hypothetical protein
MVKDGYTYHLIIVYQYSFNKFKRNFTFIPEIRYDIAAEDSFFEKKIYRQLNQSVYILQLATTYSFLNSNEF